MTKAGCFHKTPADHTILLTTGHHWRCTNCSKWGSWGPGWCYEGAPECPLKCGEPVVERVACSDECAIKIGIKTAGQKALDEEESDG